ncbi:MAG: SPOR domain-containing protein [Aquisalimonadaceae bacterium]
MEQRHKQRIIGAVVIVALGVIFLPMLLRGPVERGGLDVPMEIPPRPDSPISGQPAPTPREVEPRALERIPIRAPERDTAAAAPEPTSQPTEPASESPEPVPEPDEVPEPPADAVTESEPEPEPEPEPQPRPPASAELASFAVQVGSFRNQDNAMGLRNRLRDQGFSAFVEEATAGGNPIYRLRVGPVVDRAEAEELARRLRQTADLDGLIVSHP